MKTYNCHGTISGTITAKELIEETQEELDCLEDYYSKKAGWQNHRKVVVGKKITACHHGIQRYCESDFAHQVSTRVEGQYSDQCGVFLDSAAAAESLACEINNMQVIGLAA